MILANLLPWAVPFSPGLFTDKGRYGLPPFGADFPTGQGAIENRDAKDFV